MAQKNGRFEGGRFRRGRGSTAQTRHAVFVALFDHRLVEDLLAQVAARQLGGGFAARRAQSVDVTQAGAVFVAGLGVAVAELFPGFAVAPWASARCR